MPGMAQQVIGREETRDGFALAVPRRHEHHEAIQFTVGDALQGRDQAGTVGIDDIARMHRSDEVTEARCCRCRPRVLREGEWFYPQGPREGLQLPRRTVY